MTVGKIVEQTRTDVASAGRWVRGHGAVLRSELSRFACTHLATGSQGSAVNEFSQCLYQCIVTGTEPDNGRSRDWYSH